jgi:hypothetical protein
VARFSLLIEIDAADLHADLYTEVANRIAAEVAIDA